MIAGLFSLGHLIPLVTFGQPTQQVAPAEGKTTVEGSVQDAQTKKPIAGATVQARSEAGVVRAQQLTNAEGRYLLTLNSQQSYIFSVKAAGYITLEEQLSFTSVKTYQLRRQPTLLFHESVSSNQKIIAPAASGSIRSPGSVATSQTVPTSPPPPTGNTMASGASSAANARVAPPKTLDAKVIYTPPLVVAPVGKATQLQALQFVQSQAELLPEAKPALEQLLAFMNDHPTAEIELAGHTDNQGDFDKNLLLSKQRVEVVKEYLVKNGVAASRITTRGYGPTRPIASNNHEATRQLNRRVEMTVVKQ